MNPVVLNSKVSPRFDKHSNVLEVMEDINKAMEGIESVNTRKRFSVTVSGKYAFRDFKSPKRFSLSETPHYFYREAEARDAYRLFSLTSKAEINSEIV